MPQSATITSKSALDTLNNHVSIRKYTDQDIDQSLLEALLNAARRSPTSSNMQTYSMVVVRDPEKKAKLSEYAGNQQHVKDCPVFVALCADVSRMKQAAELHGSSLGQNLENSMVAIVDAAIVGMSLTTAAESVGLGAVMIGAMRNHPAEVADLLNLPKGAFVVYGLCLGWPDGEQIPPQKPRLPEDLVIHYESYDQSDTVDKLKQHDDELAAHYNSLNRNLNSAAWTGIVADKFSEPRRTFLREVLTDLGMSFE
ncbi:MAG: NADPH-dependent oxidoreductase [Anaerolineaceae bacterium]|nr:NADPH-dependent oxidoreductase [Anaerolineaceae bacterium]